MTNIEKETTEEQNWLKDYERDLRNSLAPEDSKSEAIVNLWTGLAYIANDETVPKQVRDFFGTLATSINGFGLNAVTKEGSLIKFPGIHSGEIAQTVDIPKSTQDSPISLKP